MIKIEDFFAPDSFSRMKAVADKHETPFVLIDLDSISRAYEELQKAFPFGTTYFAVKANPAIEITELLRDLGSSFDIASIYELDKVMSTGVSPDRISFGNTIKKARHIRYFYEKGVRMFATDCESDLRNIASEAPGSKVYCRVLVDDVPVADWPLSRKFGCHIAMAKNLLILSRELGLVPYGVSFHVGSQQKAVDAWDVVLNKVGTLYRDLLHNYSIKLDMVNLGGGLPANYVQHVAALSEYSMAITNALEKHMSGDIKPQVTIFEPGRSLVGNSGILVSEVVMASRKGGDGLYDFDVELTEEHCDVDELQQKSGDKWIYLDVGKFGGLIETMDEAIKYPLLVESRKETVKALISAGINPIEDADVLAHVAAFLPPVAAMCTCIPPQSQKLTEDDNIFTLRECETVTTAPHSSVSPSEKAFEEEISPLSDGNNNHNRDSVVTDSSTGSSGVHEFLNSAQIAFAARPRESVILAGPTCDSADILYEHSKYQLPVGVEAGDRVYLFSTGAYTTSYSAVEFNGFPCLKSVFGRFSGGQTASNSEIFNKTE